MNKGMEKKVYRILALNFGSTSSKLAYFENDVCRASSTLAHPAKELEQFPTFWAQEEYRLNAVAGFLQQNGIRPSDMDAFVAWGGHTQPMTGGVYRITPKLLEQSASEKYGHHPGDLAPRVAWRLAGGRVPAFSVDPPTIDEFSPLARYTGLPEITRKSRMQTLNQKATARRFAQDAGRPYEELNLIVIHMGGGISVVAHRHGKMVDANNGLDGDGPFASNRSGTLPAGDLIDMCYSGRYTHAEMRRRVTGEGGLKAHLGETDLREVERRIAAGDARAKEVCDAMLYQVAKEAGAMAAVLCGHVDAILLTGGMAHSEYAAAALRRQVGFLAPVKVYPGELEMQALGQAACRALLGLEPVKEL